MFVVAVPIPRRGSETVRVKPEYTFRVPSLNQVPEVGREVRAHVDDPSDLLGVLAASRQTSPQAGICTCSANDLLFWRSSAVEVFNFI